MLWFLGSLGWIVLGSGVSDNEAVLRVLRGPRTGRLGRVIGGLATDRVLRIGERLVQWNRRIVRDAAWSGIQVTASFGRILRMAAGMCV